MIKLTDQKVIDEDYKQEPKEDLIRIQKALFLHRDLYCTLDECANIWQQTSGSVQASWLDIPNDPQIILSFIETCYDFTSFELWAKNTD
jgi:hypothetical protein